MATVTAATMMTSSAAAASVSVAAAAPVAAAASVATTAAVTDELYIGLVGTLSLLVEDVKCRQGDVRNLLLTESDSATLSGVRHRHIRCEPTRNCGCTTCER